MYTNRQEMIDSYGREVIQDLTDRADPPRGCVDEAVLQRAIDAACDLADGYLVRRHVLPLAQIPADLKAHVMVLAFFNLHRNRAEEISKSVCQAKDDAMRYLSDIAAGRFVLVQPLSQTPGTLASGDAAPLFCAPPRVFDRHSLRGF
ncbi:MAG: DUF1320 domain-containing protein [Magnetococcales bacterium]|nr:DUF1320 domain-containing protein [Magnetococcales bacterium]